MSGAWMGPAIVVFCAIALAVGAAATPSPKYVPALEAPRLETGPDTPTLSQTKSADQPESRPSAPPQAAPATPARPLPADPMPGAPVPAAPQGQAPGVGIGDGFGWFATDVQDLDPDDTIARSPSAPGRVALGPSTPGADTLPPRLHWTTGPVFAVGFAIDTADATAMEVADGSGDADDALPFAIGIGVTLPSLRQVDYGALSFGIGDTATQEISEIDLSGTHQVARSNVAATAQGLYFENGTKVAGAFFNLDGARTSRVSYNSPEFSGFRAAIAGRRVANSMAPDLSLSYAAEADGWDIAGGIGYRREPGRVGKDVVHGSASVLAPFGTSLTVAAGASLIDDDWGDDRQFLYAKLGQRIDWLGFGETRLALDIFYGEPNDRTESLSVGGGLVHVIPALSTNLFLGARNYSLGVAGDDPDDIFHVYSGALVRF